MSLVTRRMRMHAYQLFKHAYQLCAIARSPTTVAPARRCSRAAPLRSTAPVFISKLHLIFITRRQFIGRHGWSPRTVHDDIDGPGEPIFWGGRTFDLEYFKHRYCACAAHARCAAPGQYWYTARVAYGWFSRSGSHIHM